MRDCRMKRILTCLLTFVMILALTAPAFADVLWEPDNRFYEKHRDECTPIVRGYYANGPEGFVTLWDAPNGSVVQAQYENGATLWVYWQYKDWGCISVWEGGGKSTDGWVPMDQMELIYDGQCFEEEYAAFITDYNGEFADYDGDAKLIPIYEYPGAPEAMETIKTDTMDVMGNLTGKEGNSYISKIFVDEDGRTWGYVNYMYGIRHFWFCLDEPDGTDFPVREVKTPVLIPAQTPVLPAKGYLPYGLVGAVVAVTGGVLAVLVKKRKKQ